MSYDNTVGLGAATWRHVAFIEQPRRRPVARRRRPHGDGGRIRWLMATDVCKHCTARGLPGRVPDRRAVPHRVRHRRRPARRLQRLRLLRPGLPVRGDRPARGRRPGVEVHAVLRPARRRAGAGLRQGVPDRLDPVRPARRAARARRPRVDELHAAGRDRGAALRPRPGRRRRRRRARSSCCSTSPRSTACRRTRWSPPATCPRMWRHAGAGRGAALAAGAARAAASPGGGREAARWETGGSTTRAGAGTATAAAAPAAGPSSRWCREAEFTSYYGRPIIKEPVWKAPDVARLPVPRRPGGRVVGAGAPAPQLSGYRALARAAKIGALGAISLSAVRPDPRPGPAGAVPEHAAGVQADLADERRLLAARRLRPGGRGGRGVRGDRDPARGRAGRHPRRAACSARRVATYTAALICDTAVPAWHEGHREMPYVFAGLRGQRRRRPRPAGGPPGGRRARP